MKYVGVMLCSMLLWANAASAEWMKVGGTHKL